MRKKPIMFALFSYDELANKIQKKCHYEIGEITQHQFPDEETLIKINSDVQERTVLFVTSLDCPNTKIVPLLFAAETARSQGALKIMLIAPYLAYMRQDKIFEPGQGITSKYFARLLSDYFDDLITIDPHLHRWHSLNDIYKIPTKTLHATNNIAQWVQNNVQNPILIGPDLESKQWVEEIAQKAKVPFLILEKIRTGDNCVEISIPNIEQYHDSVPVLIDDIISTGVTMMGTVKQLQSLKMRPAVCIGVHAIFVNNAYQELLSCGVEQIITCNTIQHRSNGIDISDDIIDWLKIRSDYS